MTRLLSTAAVCALAVGALGGCGGGGHATTGATTAPEAQAGVRVLYRVDTPGASSADIDRTVAVMRQRVGKRATVGRVGARDIAVVADGADPGATAALAARPARLGFYDWEANVLGAELQPNPRDPYLTGGQSAGRTGGLRHYAAVLLASRRAATNAPTGGAFYLVDDARRRVLAGPTGDRRNLALGLTGGRAPAGSRVVEVKPGTIVVRGEPDRRTGRPATRYFILNDAPALSGGDLTHVQQEFEAAGGPIVTFDFTARGRSAWRSVTRTIAQRGQQLQVVGGAPQTSFQHFAIVLDGELLSVPYIDFAQNPDGIDGSSGADISGGFTVASARDLARLLALGPLPVRLARVSP